MGGVVMPLTVLTLFSSPSLGPYHAWPLQWALLLPDCGDPRHRADPARLPRLPPAPHSYPSIHPSLDSWQTWTLSLHRPPTRSAGLQHRALPHRPCPGVSLAVAMGALGGWRTLGLGEHVGIDRTQL